MTLEFGRLPLVFSYFCNVCLTFLFYSFYNVCSFLSLTLTSSSPRSAWGYASYFFLSANCKCGYLYAHWLQACPIPSVSLSLSSLSLGTTHFVLPRSMQQSFIWVYYVCFCFCLKHTISSSDFRLHWWVLLNSRYSLGVQKMGGEHTPAFIPTNQPNWAARIESLTN